MTDKQTRAMVVNVSQKLSGAFPPLQAIRFGTLFPELSKPMNGECPQGICDCPERAAAFAAWELRLYLDTHPDCSEALEAYWQLCRSANGWNYAIVPGPVCGEWRWLDDPWPWELAANEGRA